jgi:putative transcriptional regulator
MSDVGKSALKGAREALDHAKGQNKQATAHQVAVPAQVDVRHIRRHLKMTRQEFAEQFGFSIRTLEKWERGERQPEASARAYLTVIDQHPDVVRQTLAG